MPATFANTTLPVTLLVVLLINMPPDDVRVTVPLAVKLPPVAAIELVEVSVVLIVRLRTSASFSTTVPAALIRTSVAFPLANVATVPVLIVLTVREPPVTLPGVNVMLELDTMIFVPPLVMVTAPVKLFELLLRFVPKLLLELNVAVPLKPANVELVVPGKMGPVWSD